MALSDFLVVEVATTFAGMYAGRVLAESGLPVLRIEASDERPLEGLDGVGDRPGSAYLSANLKKSIIRPAPDKMRELVNRIAASGAVFITDRDDYSEVRSRIVTCHIQPYRGQAGGVCELPSADVLVQAFMGGASMTGRIGGFPVPMGFPIGDLAPGIYSAIGVLRGLLDARAQLITVGAVDATVSLLSYLGCSFFVDGEDIGFIGSGHPYIVPYGAYTASDGFFIVAAYDQSFWRKLCKLLDRTDLCEDPRYKRFTGRRDNRNELNALLNSLFSRKTVAEWIRLLQQSDIPNAPVFSLQQALRHEVVTARNMVTNIDGIPLLDSPIMNLCDRNAGGTGKPRLARDPGALSRLLPISEQELRQYCADAGTTG